VPSSTDIAGPLDPATTVVSIYSRDDGVVPPSASPVEGAVNIEVSGTHSGLVYNADVYRHLGRVLAGLDPNEAPLLGRRSTRAPRVP
jgi:hypothetical protein